MKKIFVMLLISCLFMGVVLADVTTEPELETLTIENNEDLVILFTIPDNYDFYETFVVEYKGQTIEFDGNIVDMAPHGTYKTRYDFLINVGDYGEKESFLGPALQFRDVNIHDLHLTGDVPAYIGQGDNLHIIAEITGIINGYLIILKPISVSIRNVKSE